MIFFSFSIRMSSPFQLKSSVVLALCVSLCSKIVPRCHAGYPPASSLELSGLTHLNIEAAIYCQSFSCFVERKKNTTDFERFPCEIMHGGLYELIISSMLNFCFVVR